LALKATASIEITYNNDRYAVQEHSRLPITVLLRSSHMWFPVSE